MKQRTTASPTQQHFAQAKLDTLAQPSVESPNYYSDDHEDEEDYERMALVFRVRFRQFAAELLGTFIFVYLGQAALTSLELTGTQSDMLTRQLAAALSYGLAFAFASLLVLSLSGAHLNPAYTFASAVFGRMGWPQAFGYFCAQYLGAFAAAVLLHVTYRDKLTQRHTEGMLMGPNAPLRAHGSILSTGKLFASHPPTEVSLGQLAVSYTLASAHLTLLLLAINESRLVRIARSHRPLYLAGALALVLVAFSANGGPVWNPAQDFSPRLFIGLFGWGLSAFNLYNYKYWCLCGLVTPHVGALLGFAFYRLFDHLRGIKEEPVGRLQQANTNHRHQQQHHFHHHVNLV